MGTEARVGMDQGVLGRDVARPATPSVRADIWLTRVGISITIVAFGLLGRDLRTDSAAALAEGALAIVGLVTFVSFVIFLVYGNLVYQFARLGALHRRRQHVAPTRGDLDRVLREAPPVQVLVPAYREEEGVVRQTLLSAALQEYPDVDVVLLIDDPPIDADPTNMELLEAVRLLPAEIGAALDVPLGVVSTGRAAFERQRMNDSRLWLRHRRKLDNESMRLAGVYEECAAWLERLADHQPLHDHTDVLFAGRILLEPANEMRRAAEDILASVLGGHCLTADEIDTCYLRLTARFTARLSSFERKRYVNLSHEPNKAMNLNSYLSLLGGAWQERADDLGLHLVAASLDDAELVCPTPCYVLTLDADSLVVDEYLAKLVSVMERPGNDRLAVVQTPYSAVPGAENPIERIAGATTDIQYLIHQGFSAYSATYWVGANAVIRYDALNDIKAEECERGFTITRYIHDRTVIEDTESSIDLVAKDWTLLNYPERLSYSATPPDFGSLVIQRRRWANGGLIILPKLLRHLLGELRSRRLSLGEAFMRTHYLTSIAGTTIGMILILSIRFDRDLASVWLPATAVPYFVLYARDLRLSGYSRLDLVRVYALNLLLLPVNLGGILKSLQQGITRRKIPFGRTPKVAGRTAAPRIFLVATIVMLGQWAAGVVLDATSGSWPFALFGLTNVALLMYAVTTFVGWRHLVVDVLPTPRQAMVTPRARLGSHGDPAPVSLAHEHPTIATPDRGRRRAANETSADDVATM